MRLKSLEKIQEAAEIALKEGEERKLKLNEARKKRLEEIAEERIKRHEIRSSISKSRNISPIDQKDYIFKKY